MNGPTVYGTLFDASTDELRKEIHRVVQEDISSAVERVTVQLTQIMAASYKEGLRHGFQQGVQAVEGHAEYEMSPARSPRDDEAAK